MIINVNIPGREYDVICGAGEIQQLGSVLDCTVPGARLALLTDDKVNSLHADSVCALIEKSGYSYIKYVIKNGECSKTPETLFDFLEFMAENQITRTDCVMALGGGVVGDIAGFAAAIYQRGIDLIQIPTTLLAMVDSSVGGKTAVDLKGGKNLAGAFHQPRAVICDTDFLETLDKNDFRDGCAEVIKYGLIKDKALFESLMGGTKSVCERAVARCIEIKRDTVVADEFDRGERALLNYGHTVGHAIEKLSNFKLTHGQCVAKGMLVASKIARELQMCDIVGVTEQILLDYGFGLDINYSAKEIAEAAMNDKKKSKDTLTLILAEDVGKCVCRKIKATELEELLLKAL